VQARATQFIFNRQQSYVVAQAKEDLRGTTLATSAKREEVIYHVASLYLDAERSTRLGEMARKEVASLEKVLETVQHRVAEGRELPLAAKQAAVNLARARQVAENLETDRETLETSLAVVLGLSADDRVRAVPEERPVPAMPLSEQNAVEEAMRSNKELQRMQSQLISKGLEIRGTRAARLPRVDLVAQYGLFARFNNYEDFFQKFQRNNGQVGISFQLPVLPGPGIDAQTSQSEAEMGKIRVEMNQLRNRINQDVRQSYRDIRKAEAAREVARLDLDWAREQLSVRLAQMQEGRILMREVEEARIIENDKWIAFYDAQYALERARLGLLRQTGELLASIK
jgi:outer membrane protein TolC